MARIGTDADPGVDGGLNQVADMVVRAALQGDKDAWKEIGDRIDGKATQVLASDPDAPMQINVVNYAK